MGEKLDSRTKWTYCIGATGRDAAYALVSMYLLTYIQYTMSLTKAQFLAISAIMIVCLIWDAINDPLMGIIIENMHFKWGKFRPWILVGCILDAIVIILLFSVRPEGWGFVAVFGVLYLLWGMTYTMNDIAYWGMLPSLSSDPKERNTLVTLMSVFVCVGQFSVAGLLPTFVAGNAVNAYRGAAIIIASAFIAFQVLTFLGVKERPRQDNVDKLSLKQMFKVFGRNDQLVVIAIVSLLFNIANGLLIAFGVNLFYVEYGYSEGGDMVFLFTVMYGLGTLLSQVAYPFAAKKLSRDKILMWTVIVACVGYVLLAMIGFVFPMSKAVICLIGFVIFFCQGLANLVIVVMLNNTIEYDELKFHERHDSVISAARSFTVKLAGAINQGIVALVLIVSGIYAASQDVSALEIAMGRGESTKEEVLSQADAILGAVTTKEKLIFRLGIVLIPMVALCISYFVTHAKYKISEQEYDSIVQQIKDREEKGEIKAE